MINWKRPIGGALLATMLLTGAAFAATPSASAAERGVRAERVGRAEQGDRLERLAAKLAERPELQAWKEAAEQGKSLREQMRAQREQNKAIATQVKESLQDDPAQIEALKAEMAPLKEQAMSLHEQRQAGRAALKALWQQYRSAVKAGDQAAAEATAQQLAEQRTAQNGLLTQLLELMQERLTILNRYL